MTGRHRLNKTEIKQTKINVMKCRCPSSSGTVITNQFNKYVRYIKRFPGTSRLFSTLNNFEPGAIKTWLGHWSACSRLNFILGKINMRVVSLWERSSW